MSTHANTVSDFAEGQDAHNFKRRRISRIDDRGTRISLLKKIPSAISSTPLTAENTKFPQASMKTTVSSLAASSSEMEGPVSQPPPSTTHRRLAELRRDQAFPDRRASHRMSIVKSYLQGGKPALSPELESVFSKYQAREALAASKTATEVVELSRLPQNEPDSERTIFEAREQKGEINGTKSSSSVATSHGGTTARSTRRRTASLPDAKTQVDDSPTETSKIDDNLETATETFDAVNTAIVNELCFTMLQVGSWGRELTEYRLQLDSGAVQQHRIWGFKNGQDEIIEADGESRRPIPGTTIRKHPPHELLEAAFLELWDWAHDLQEEHIVMLEVTDIMKEELRRLKRLPKTPAFMLHDETAGLFGLEYQLGRLKKENQELRTALDEPDNYKTYSVHDEGRWDLFHKRMETIAAQSSASKNEDEPQWKALAQQYQEEKSQLVHKLAVIREHHFRKESELEDLKKQVSLQQAHMIAREREYSMVVGHNKNLLQEINDARILQEDAKYQLSNQRRHEKGLRRRNTDLQQVLRMSKGEAALSMQQQIEALEKEYQKMKQRCSTLMQAQRQQMENFMPQVLAQQSHQQEQMQRQIENLTLVQYLSRERAQQKSESSAASTDAMKAIRKGRSGPAQYAMPTTDSVPNETGSEDDPETSDTSSEEVVQPPKVRKNRPNPIQSNTRKPQGLPEAYRSPKPEGYYPEPKSDVVRFVPHNAQQQEALSDSQSSNSSETSKHSSNSSSTECGGDVDDATKAELEKIWETLEAWPVHFRAIDFTDRAKVLFDVPAFNGNGRWLTLEQGKIVPVLTQSTGSYWLVNTSDEQENSVYLVPQIALALVCPEGLVYNEPLMVEKTYGDLKRGQIVLSAHLSNTQGPSADELGEQIYCIRRHDGFPAFVPAEYLSKPRFEINNVDTKECKCDEPQPYQREGVVLSDCEDVTCSFKLRKEDVVDVAHLVPGAGTCCVRRRVTGEQGFVDACHLQLRLRQVLNLTEEGFVLQLTPRFYDYRYWLPGDEKDFEQARAEQPLQNVADLPYSDEARRAWEENKQGDNPGHRKWHKAVAVSRRDKVYKDWEVQSPRGNHYVRFQAFQRLPPFYKAILPVNPFGGVTSGSFRTRSKSMNKYRSDKVAPLRCRAPHIGDQPHRSIKDGRMWTTPDEEDVESGHESEPITRTTRTRKRKYVFSKNQVFKVQDPRPPDRHDTMLLGPWADPTSWERTNLVSGRYLYGHLTPKGENRLWERSNRTRPFPVDDGDDIFLPRFPEVPFAESSNGHLTALGALKQDHQRDFALVYSTIEDDENRLVEISHFDSQYPDSDKLAIRDLAENQLDCVESERIKKVLDLEWTEPLLRTAIAKHSSGDARSVVLLRRNAANSIWICLVEERFIDVSTESLALQHKDQWVSYTDILPQINRAERQLPRPPLHDLSIPEPSEWTYAYLVGEDQIGKGPGYLNVKEADFVIPRSEFSPSTQRYCVSYLNPQAGGLVSSDIIDWRKPRLTSYPVLHDLGRGDSPWVILLKEEGDKVCYSFPNLSRRWCYRDEIKLDVANAKLFALSELLDQDCIRLFNPVPALPEPGSIIEDSGLGSTEVATTAQESGIIHDIATEAHAPAQRHSASSQAPEQIDDTTNVVEVGVSTPTTRVGKAFGSQRDGIRQARKEMTDKSNVRDFAIEDHDHKNQPAAHVTLDRDRAVTASHEHQVDKDSTSEVPEPTSKASAQTVLAGEAENEPDEGVSIIVKDSKARPYSQQRPPTPRTNAIPDGHPESPLNDEDTNSMISDVDDASESIDDFAGIHPKETKPIESSPQFQQGWSLSSAAEAISRALRSSSNSSSSSSSNSSFDSSVPNFDWSPKPKSKGNALYSDRTDMTDFSDEGYYSQNNSRNNKLFGAGPVVEDMHPSDQDGTLEEGYGESYPPEDFQERLAWKEKIEREDREQKERIWGKNWELLDPDYRFQALLEHMKRQASVQNSQPLNFSIGEAKPTAFIKALPHPILVPIDPPAKQSEEANSLHETASEACRSTSKSSGSDRDLSFASSLLPQQRTRAEQLFIWLFLQLYHITQLFSNMVSDLRRSGNLGRLGNYLPSVGSRPNRFRKSSPNPNVGLAINLVYWTGLTWLLIGMYSARQEWLDSNGVGLLRGASLVRDRRNAAMGGGWEWMGMSLGGC